MYKTIIIGAGPSGLFASNFLEDCLILEKNNQPGLKLLMTGNGRCNITNKKTNNDFLNNIKHNKKYLYSTINKFGPKEVYEYFTKNKVYLKEEEDNKIFPQSDKAVDILNCLLKNSKAKINYNEEVIQINNNPLEVITTKNKYKCENLIIACGGSSFPHTGSSGDHILLANQINQPTTPLLSAESALITDKVFDIAGSSAIVKIKYQKQITEGPLIFTHKGLSGAAIMNISEFVIPNTTIKIDFIKDKTEQELLDEINTYDRNKEIISFFKPYLQKRLVEYLLKDYVNTTIKSLAQNTLIKIINNLKNYEILIKKVEDIKLAYVTKGGIDLKYVDTKTFESKTNKNIYFIGEALDIHGPIGGYNLTLALSTAYSVKEAIK